ncbi:hypothetical protein BU23DRAFT_554896 [Bimuria novae-zelandiae CBS 107.79]|uniref:Uncharacterized protein n=1 Tax=Bimuria novae-zelandiae CBS 107.79 TaxID=1447943 RepID=A0A6A5V6F3_9PLEO|nr:hypothetical protein BU23DRAFT_554896 [Bimuria novae-zelandiae CBS 107.79]
MVILGGLEIVAGGYLVHRYHKKQKEKKRLVEEAQQRRNNTFPGAKPHYQHHHQYQAGPIPQQKYGCVAHGPPNRPPPPFAPPHRPYTEPPAHRPHHSPSSSQPQPFMIPRRPVPKRQYTQQPYEAAPPIIIQPLQRADSFATISRMPIANGYRPSDVTEDAPFPPRPHNQQLSPIPQSPMNSPYGNPGFAVSSPALGNNPTTPTYGPGLRGGGHTVDDNWETYNQRPSHAHYAPSESTALGEARDDDPPPPYRP